MSWLIGSRSLKTFQVSSGRSTLRALHPTASRETAQQSRFWALHGRALECVEAAGGQEGSGMLTQHSPADPAPPGRGCRHTAGKLRDSLHVLLGGLCAADAAGALWARRVRSWLLRYHLNALCCVIISLSPACPWHYLKSGGI